jgi:quercetin dioxygenase-like cupin family protein
MENTNNIFPQGEKAPPDFFTGSAFVNRLIPDKEGVYNCQVYDVVFEAGGAEQLA